MAVTARRGIVVNNAGVLGARNCSAATSRKCETVFETNYFGVLRVAKAFAPCWPQRQRSLGGHRVGAVLGPGFGGYGDSKAAVWSTTNSLRIELETQGTLVTGVHLGYTDTDMVSASTCRRTAPTRWPGKSRWH